MCCYVYVCVVDRNVVRWYLSLHTHTHHRHYHHEHACGALTLNPSWRSASAATEPAAPPPTMTNVRVSHESHLPIGFLARGVFGTCTVTSSFCGGSALSLVCVCVMCCAGLCVSAGACCVCLLSVVSVCGCVCVSVVSVCVCSGTEGHFCVCMCVCLPSL